MFNEIGQKYLSPFTPFSLYPRASDRAAWESLDAQWKEETIRQGEGYLNYDYPSLSATDFMAFSRTGNRVLYEDKTFGKRYALSALVLAECVEDKGRFLDDIINGIFSICEESAWQLPAHNSYMRDTPQLLLPDVTAPIMDLFSCETGAVLAAAYYLLAARLDEICPLIGKRIMYELEQRIFTPYLNCHFWWMGNGKDPMNNWTIWCTQNTLLCFFLMDTPAELRYEVLKKACQSTDYFLDEYGEDGCCDEGAQYYRHAGLCLFNTTELLNAVTGDSFARLYQEPKIRNIAAYILNVHIEDKYYVNFADCSPIAGRCSAREFLFAKRVGNENMAAFAAADFLAGLDTTLLLPTENSMYYRLQNGFTVSEIRQYASSHTAAAAHSDLYYASVGLLIARDDTLCLAVKAGDNGDSHNHNDTGSVTVYKNGSPLLIDVGVESYTKKTFSSRRYEIWTMQSRYHNLPTVNGVMQQDGEQFKACDVSHLLSDSLCEIEMDIAPAYPPEAGLTYYRRKASLIKGEEIVITDSFAFAPDARGHEVILSFMTYEKPVLTETADSGDKDLTFSIGELGSLQMDGGSLVEIEAIPITDARLQTAWEHEVYRILVKAQGNEVAVHLS